MEEIWKDIQDYQGLYQISNLGRVKSVTYRQGKILKPYKRSDGYFTVSLHKNTKRKLVRIHRLIAFAFIPNPDNKPEINHKNRNPGDNRIENLEWVTPKENIQHSFRVGTRKKSNPNLNGEVNGEKNPMAKLIKSQVLDIRSRENYGYGFYRRLAKEFNVSPHLISKIYNRQLWKHI